MTRATRTWFAAAGMLIGVAASAADLPRLPGKLRLLRSPDSPGPVTFDHGTHVDGSRPAGSCTACHAGTFPILGKSAAEPAPGITHDRMKGGQACGKCHGRQAFAFDDCTMCHQM